MLENKKQMNKNKIYHFGHKELGLGTSQANGILKKSSRGLHKTIIYDQVASVNIVRNVKPYNIKVCDGRLHHLLDHII
jgi:hypothetical protein